MKYYILPAIFVFTGLIVWKLFQTSLSVGGMSLQNGHGISAIDPEPSPACARALASSNALDLHSWWPTHEQSAAEPIFKARDAP